jgi:hypothetical protein
MEHEGSVDRDIERLKNKSQQGARNVVTEVLNDPIVRNMIKKSVLQETITSGLVMACFFLGMFKLYDVAKAVFNFNWVVDLIVGLVLTVFSLSYMLKNFKQK